MNVLFLTQSKTLSVFYDLACAIKDRTILGKTGFYIADSAFYDKFKREQPDICSGNYELLKEWEIIERSKNIKPDMLRLREYEKRFGDPFLWNALVADRRIYLGKRTTLEQDYSSRFNHDRMLAIVQAGLEEMERFFDRVRPDAVIGFICVTIGEYLAYLVAKSHNIPFLSLRPTRIRNYFFAGESIFEPSEQLKELYRRISEEGIPESLRQEISLYLSEIRMTHAMYEGVLPPPKASSKKGIGRYLIGTAALIMNLGSLIRQYYDYNLGEYRHDNHHRGVFYPIWLKKVKRPLRIRYADFILKKKYVDADTLTSIDYAFYPLHKEPEVTLLVYGRPYMNQIEVVRNLARSLPVGMKLIVKEHPAAIGYHPLSYYKKLLAIPNVILAHQGKTSRELIQNSRLVAIVSGSVGLEAVMMRKPVVILGRVPFSFLPETMVRHVRDLDRLAWDINDLLENHSHDEAALMAYLSAVIEGSVPVDFYSVLLGRKGVYRPGEGTEKTEDLYQKQIEALSKYIFKNLDSEYYNSSLDRKKDKFAFE